MVRIETEEDNFDAAFWTHCKRVRGEIMYAKEDGVEVIKAKGDQGLEKRFCCKNGEERTGFGAVQERK